MLDAFIEVENDIPAVNAPTGGGQLGTGLLPLAALGIQRVQAVT